MCPKKPPTISKKPGHILKIRRKTTGAAFDSPYIKTINTCCRSAIRAIVLSSLMQECAMRTDANLQAKQADKATPTETRPSARIWYGGVAGRTLFLIVLIVLTARVASPQIERLSSVYETPGDLIRVLMGVGVCAWFVVNLFVLPKDAGAYRTWMYLGLALLPLAVLCAFVVW
jgi:hypothetical protein